MKDPTPKGVPARTLSIPRADGTQVYLADYAYTANGLTFMGQGAEHDGDRALIEELMNVVMRSPGRRTRRRRRA